MSDKPQNLLRFVYWWLEPRSTNRDDIFRERIIRVTLLIVITLGVLSFFSTVFVFESEWGLISFPTLHVVGLMFCFISAFALLQNRLMSAGWFLVLTILFGGGGLILLGRQTDTVSAILNGIPVFLFVPLIATLVLSRNSILYVSLLSAFFYGVCQFAFDIGEFEFFGIAPDAQITSMLLLLLMEGVLLRQLRVEFDARLQSLTQSLQQTEVARHQAEDARLQAEQDRIRAQDADRAKTQFLANMSHELRTPLNAIIGYDEAMLGGMVGEFTPKQTQLLGHIQKNSRRLLALINDVLDLSKIESGSVELYLAPMSPRKVITETSESLRALAAEKPIALETSFADDVPEVVMSDAKKLEQVLVNLLSNAIKFTSEGSVSVYVSLAEKDRWRCTVTDTGIGMPPESLEYIFEPFRQVDNSNTRHFKGTGLGLAISKRLVDRMGGDIAVESQEGEGTTFTVTLPRNPLVDNEQATESQEMATI